MIFFQLLLVVLFIVYSTDFDDKHTILSFTKKTLILLFVN